MTERPTHQRGGRGRRPPDRLAAAERHLRHRHQVGRVVRGAAVHDRPHQRRAVVDLDADFVADRGRAQAGARGARPARLPDRRSRRTRCSRAADRDGCVPDDFYSTTNLKTLVRHGGRWLEVERQRMDSVDRHRRRRARSAASCATCGRATRSCAASRASGRCRSSRSAIASASRS